MFSHSVLWVNGLLFESVCRSQEVCPRPSLSSGSLKMRAVRTPIMASPGLMETPSLVSELFPQGPQMASEVTRTPQVPASVSCPCLHPSQPFLCAQVLRPSDELLRMFVTLVFIVAKYCWTFRHKWLDNSIMVLFSYLKYVVDMHSFFKKRYLPSI